jgi:peptidoglycan DL-endopeptidase CwlO
MAGRARSAVLCTVVGAALLAAASPARSDGPVAAKRAEASRVLTEVRALDDRLEQSVEAYDLARVRLSSNERASKANAGELRVARRNLRTAQRRVAARLVDLYTAGESDSPLAVILGARSLGELIDRLETARQVADEDARVARAVSTFRAQVARQGRNLRREHDRRARLVARLAAQRLEIEARLQERRRLLSSITSEIARLQAQERTQQAALRRQAETRLVAERAARRAQAAPEPTFGVSAVTPEGVGVAPDTRHAHVVPIAMQYLGVPYLWGGASPATGFDCSGFVLYVYAQVGISLPHNAALQYQHGVPVAKDDLQPGDIVFFDDLGHDGIYIGGGQFIQAPRTGDVVKISSLSEPWYAAEYYGARRLP